MDKIFKQLYPGVDEKYLERAFKKLKENGCPEGEDLRLGLVSSWRQKSLKMPLEEVKKMKTIDELWYGNISPFEQCTRGDKRLKELLSLMARNRDELGETLTEKQKETLEKFEDCMNEMHSVTERDAFSYGFRLGVQLMAESFLLPIGEDEST